MALFSKVLIPLDGSKLAEEAIAAVEHQLGNADDVLLFTSIDPAVGRAFTDAARQQDISVLGAVERYLDDAVEKLRHAGIPARRAFHQDPDAGEGVLRAIREEKPSVLVMSSHGRTGLTRFVMGSVASKIVNHALCPTLVIPLGDRR